MGTGSLVYEAAMALSAVSHDRAELVLACRQLIEHRPSSGPLVWLAARMLTGADAGTEAWDAAEMIERDKTDRELEHALPGSTGVIVIGAPEAASKALTARGDIEVFVADTTGEGYGLVHRLDLDDRLTVDVPLRGLGSAVADGDLVLLETDALGPEAAICVVGSLAAAAIAKQVGTDRGILLDLTTVDQVPITLLLDLIETTDRLGLASVDELITRPPARNAEGAVLRVELLAAPPGDVGGAASDLRLTESVLASYAAMVAPADGPIAPLRTVLQAAMSDELNTEVRRTFTDAVFDLVATGTADFDVVESSRITLATRTATLPISIRNSQTLAMNVIVRITSEKLRFPDGEELRLALEPGLNELEVPVETVTSGDARILITVTSPDGRLDLAGGSVNVRSTAISGLGLVVSLVSLAVLLTWWLRTIIRVRRSRRAATVSSTPSADDGNPAVSVNEESTS